MQHPEFPVFAFIAAFLVLIPLPWHWRARNIGILGLIFWLFAVNIIYAINSLIWAGNVRNPAPIWCDIATKILVGSSYALPLATLCICKHLESVSSSRKVSYDMSDKRRRMIFDGIMCFGVPLIFMALHYIVQGHRYDIFENTGCQAAVYISVQAILIIWFPQLLFSIITLIYAALALHNFVRRRLTFAAHLQNSNSALTTNRYLRLIAMSITEMIWGTALTAFNLYNNVAPGLRPWTTWADVHSNFSRVDLYTTAEIAPAFLTTMYIFWWALPVSAFIFFLFFGFGEEALKEYRKICMWFRKTVLRKKDEKSFIFTTSFPNFQSRRAPTHILQLKTTSSSISTDKYPRTPTSATSSVPSTSTPNKLEEASADSETVTISTMSYYGLSTDHADSAPPSASAHPHIIISNAFHRPSLTPSVPESVVPSLQQYPERSELSTLTPAFHHPFLPAGPHPTVFSPLMPHGGVMVTVHRQASVDNIV